MIRTKLKWLVCMQLLPARTIIQAWCDPIDLVADTPAGLVWSEIDWRLAA
jgi:hypothetical protein